jgi:hypothetical protein
MEICIRSMEIFKSGGRGRDRTYDQSIKSRMLYQLSYASRDVCTSGGVELTAELRRHLGKNITMNYAAAANSAHVDSLRFLPRNR